MPRYDAAPIGHTCPMINEVIDFIKKIEFNLDDEDQKDLSDERKTILEVLEKIRTANHTLRQWGNEENQEKEEFEKDRDSLEKDIKYLNSDIEDLQSEISKLNERISELEDELSEI